MLFKKYFIAITIPEPGFGQIEQLKQTLFEEHQLKGGLRSPAHITLHRPFEWKESKEAQLINTLKQFVFPKPINIHLQQFGYFEPRVVYVQVIPNAALNELHESLTQFVKRELKIFNESDDLRGFHPHVTIAFRDLKKPMFYQLKTQFEKQSFDFSFDHQKIALLKFDKKWQVIHQF